MEVEDRFTDPLTSVSFTVEEAVNRCGFGWFQVKVSLFVGLLWAMNAVLIFLLIVVSPEARCELNLTPLEESLITTAAFSGTLVGSSIWGSLSDRYGRKKCLLINGVCVFLSVLMGCFAFNYSYLVASWALLGFMISGEASVVTFYSEFLPAKQRTISFLFIHVLFVLGICFVVGAAVLVLTYFKLSWHWLNGVATAVVGLHFFLFLLITESPYYLLTSGKNVEAKSVLERLAKDNKKTLPIGRLVLQQETKVSISLDADEEDYSEDFDVQELIASDPRPSKKRGRFRDLFATSQQTATTVLLSLIWLCSSFGYFGSVLLTTERLDLLDVLHAENKTDGTVWPCGVGAADFRNISSKGQCEVLTMNDYFQFLWTSGAELPGLVITLLLAKYMGRKRLLALELTIPNDVHHFYHSFLDHRQLASRLHVHFRGLSNRNSITGGGILQRCWSSWCSCVSFSGPGPYYPDCPRNRGNVWRTLYTCWHMLSFSSC
ncbi:synaptic vesicle 2-related protein-like isoform X2 [Oscarella lobularis]|uniref:synaptic vesicle 2-related protein-like isoform X2 n=1 Tax=Oscarella lobularis TaxID=121494 RepID=UPI0033133772